MRSENMLNKILKAVIFAGIFLLLFIPFIVSKSMFFPFITGKNFAFRIIVEIILSGWLMLAWRDARYRLNFSWVFAALLMFIGAVTVADIFGKDFLRSFWSNYERMDGLITLLHLFAFFVVAGSVMNTKYLWERFIQTSVGASVLMSIYSIFQLLGFIVINQGGVRVDATFGNATYLAGYLLFNIFFAAFLFAQKHTANWLRAVYGAVISLHIFILFNTMTRGAILAFLGGAVLIALLIILFSKTAADIKKYAIGALVGIVFVVGVFVALKNVSFVRESQVFGRLADISIEAGKSRFLVWNVAWQGIKERPILGWGQDNFITAFSKHYNPRMYTEEPWFDRAHNIILDWLIAGGALGLAAYLFVFLAAIYAIWFYPKRRANENVGESPLDGRISFSFMEKSILTGLFAAYLFHNIFVFDNVVSYIFFFSVLAFVHGASIEKRKNIANDEKKISTEWKEFADRLIGPLIILTLVSFLYVLNVKSIIGNRGLLRAIDIRSVQQLPTQEARETVLREKFITFDTALASGFLGRMEAREQLVQSANSLAGAPISQLMKQEFFTLARAEMGKQIEEAPENLRPRLFLASLFLRYRLFDEAIIEIEESFKISNTKQDMYYLLASAYTNIGNMEKSIELTKQAFLLEQSNERARKIYAATLIRAGRAGEAEEILSALSEESFLFDPDIVDAYASIGRFEKLTSFWEERVKREPGNLQARTSLAASYIQSGNRSRAISELERVIELFPEFKTQGEFFINEIKAGRNP